MEVKRDDWKARMLFGSFRLQSANLGLPCARRAPVSADFEPLGGERGQTVHARLQLGACLVLGLPQYYISCMG